MTALLVTVSPVSLAASALFQYVSFDLLWWMAIAFGVASLAATGDSRWWLLIGAAIGLGVLTKYTIAFLVAGLALAVFATDPLRHLRERWLWLGALLAVVIAAPHLVWQLQHHFESLQFLRDIHERDIRIGRTDHFVVEQLYLSANVVSAPFWMAGLIALFTRRFARFRALGIMASGSNAFWDRGYGGGRASTVIVLGATREDVAESCASVTLAARIANRYGVANEESREHPDIFICRGLKMSWAELWPRVRSFG